LSSKSKPRPQKKADRKTEPKQTGKPEWIRPAATMPLAMVSSRHEAEMVTREGRGFSPGETESAQIPGVLVRRWAIPIDVRRGSVLESNVESLKAWFAGARREELAEPKPKSEKTERPEKPKKAPARKKKVPAA